MNQLEFKAYISGKDLQITKKNILNYFINLFFIVTVTSICILLKKLHTNYTALYRLISYFSHIVIIREGTQIMRKFLLEKVPSKKMLRNKKKMKPPKSIGHFGHYL